MNASTLGPFFRRFSILLMKEIRHHLHTSPRENIHIFKISYTANHLQKYPHNSSSHVQLFLWLNPFFPYKNPFSFSLHHIRPFWGDDFPPPIPPTNFPPGHHHRRARRPPQSWRLSLGRFPWWQKRSNDKSDHMESKSKSIRFATHEVAKQKLFFHAFQHSFPVTLRSHANSRQILEWYARRRKSQKRPNWIQSSKVITSPFQANFANAFFSSFLKSFTKFIYFPPKKNRTVVFALGFWRIPGGENVIMLEWQLRFGWQ